MIISFLSVVASCMIPTPNRVNEVMTLFTISQFQQTPSQAPVLAELISHGNHLGDPHSYGSGNTHFL